MAAVSSFYYKLYFGSKCHTRKRGKTRKHVLKGKPVRSSCLKHSRNGIHSILCRTVKEIKLSHNEHLFLSLILLNKTLRSSDRYSRTSLKESLLSTDNKALDLNCPEQNI